MAISIPDLLKGFGLSSESVERVRLSRGVVGRTTYAVGGLFVVLAIVAGRIDPLYLLWVAGFATAAFAMYFIGVLAFAHKNPAVALLEGAELLHWQQTELAAKGMTAVPTAPVLISDPAQTHALPVGTAPQPESVAEGSDGPAA